MNTRQLHPDSPWLLALLAALVALGPLSVDLYLPAMPAMMRAFDTDISQMQLTLSSYLAGFAVFHLACGPLADRFGRKPVLLGGTLLFVVACVGCSRSETVGELLLFRFLQGIGACVGPTLARAVTRDIFGPTGAARALSIIAMLMALAPAVAPTLGGVLLLVLPWPSLFIFLGLYGGLMIVLMQIFLPESLPRVQSLHPQAIARNYGELLVDPLFLTVTLSSSLVYAGMMVYIACSSFVYIDMLGVAPEYFGLVFLSFVVGYMAGSGLSARLSRHQDSERVMRLGIITAMGASLLLLACSYTWPSSVLALVLPMALYSVAMGLVLPHAMAIALRPFAHIAGTASALMGFIQMSLAAGSSALAGRFLSTSPLPMVWFLLLLVSVSLLLGLRAHALHARTKP